MARLACTPGRAPNTYFLRNVYPSSNRLGAADSYRVATTNSNDFLATASLVQARPYRAERRPPDRLLDVARRGAPGVPGPPRWRMRHGPGWRRVDPGSPEGGLPVPRGHDSLVRWPLPCFRCARRWNCRGQRCRHRRAPEAGRRDRRRRLHRCGHSRIGDQQRRLGQGWLHRAQRRWPGRGHLRRPSPSPGSMPSSISYVEAHGTATAIGDPVEIAALTRAFRADTDKTQYCAIGSIKTNFGHLDAAGGVAGSSRPSSP